MREFEWEDRKFKECLKITGKIKEIKDSEIEIVTNAILEENEIIKRKKDVYRDIGCLTMRYGGISVIVNEISNGQNEDSFTGATVLEPQRGLYLDNIVVLDFASLYPTIMISRNLCFSTLIN